MKDIKIKDYLLRVSSQRGFDAFVQVFVDAINESIDGNLTPDSMHQLSADQITLLGWNFLRNEVLEGGYIQLIHNGYGEFIFHNPFGAAMRAWGLVELGKQIVKAGKYYERYREEIEQDMSYDDFMALYEQMPEFDDLDDYFVEKEEQWTEQIAQYIDEHINNFATIENE